MEPKVSSSKKINKISKPLPRLTKKNKEIRLKLQKSEIREFPGGTVVKNPPANAGDTGLSPGQGRSHMLRSN